jgi:hypothetical protein
MSKTDQQNPKKASVYESNSFKLVENKKRNLRNEEEEEEKDNWKKTTAKDNYDEIPYGISKGSTIRVNYQSWTILRDQKKLPQMIKKAISDRKIKMDEMATLRVLTELHCSDNVMFRKTAEATVEAASWEHLHGLSEKGDLMVSIAMDVNDEVESFKECVIQMYQRAVYKATKHPDRNFGEVIEEEIMYEEAEYLKLAKKGGTNMEMDKFASIWLLLLQHEIGEEWKGDTSMRQPKIKEKLLEIARQIVAVAEDPHKSKAKFFIDWFNSKDGPLAVKTIEKYNPTIDAWLDPDVISFLPKTTFNEYAGFRRNYNTNLDDLVSNNIKKNKKDVMNCCQMFEILEKAICIHWNGANSVEEVEINREEEKEALKQAIKNLAKNLASLFAPGLPASISKIYQGEKEMLEDQNSEIRSKGIIITGIPHNTTQQVLETDVVMMLRSINLEYIDEDLQKNIKTSSWKNKKVIDDIGTLEIKLSTETVFGATAGEGKICRFNMFTGKKENRITPRFNPPFLSSNNYIIQPDMGGILLPYPVAYIRGISSDPSTTRIQVIEIERLLGTIMDKAVWRIIVVPKLTSISYYDKVAKKDKTKKITEIIGILQTTVARESIDWTNKITDKIFNTKSSKIIECGGFTFEMKKYIDRNQDPMFLRKMTIPAQIIVLAGIKDEADTEEILKIVMNTGIIQREGIKNVYRQELKCDHWDPFKMVEKKEDSIIISLDTEHPTVKITYSMLANVQEFISEGSEIHIRKGPIGMNQNLYYPGVLDEKVIRPKQVKNPYNVEEGYTPTKKEDIEKLGQVKKAHLMNFAEAVRNKDDDTSKKRKENHERVDYLEKQVSDLCEEIKEMKAKTMTKAEMKSILEMQGVEAETLVNAVHQRLDKVEEQTQRNSTAFETKFTMVIENQTISIMSEMRSILLQERKDQLIATLNPNKRIKESNAEEANDETESNVT